MLLRDDTAVFPLRVWGSASASIAPSSVVRVDNVSVREHSRPGDEGRTAFPYELCACPGFKGTECCLTTYTGPELFRVDLSRPPLPPSGSIAQLSLAPEGAFVSVVGLVRQVWPPRALRTRTGRETLKAQRLNCRPSWDDDVEEASELSPNLTVVYVMNAKISKYNDKPGLSLSAESILIRNPAARETSGLLRLGETLPPITGGPERALTAVSAKDIVDYYYAASLQRLMADRSPAETYGHYVGLLSEVSVSVYDSCPQCLRKIAAALCPKCGAVDMAPCLFSRFAEAFKCSAATSSSDCLAVTEDGADTVVPWWRCVGDAVTSATKETILGYRSLGSVAQPGALAHDKVFLPATGGTMTVDVEFTTSNEFGGLSVSLVDAASWNGAVLGEGGPSLSYFNHPNAYTSAQAAGNQLMVRDGVEANYPYFSLDSTMVPLDKWCSPGSYASVSVTFAFYKRQTNITLRTLTECSTCNAWVSASTDAPRNAWLKTLTITVTVVSYQVDVQRVQITQTGANWTSLQGSGSGTVTLPSEGEWQLRVWAYSQACGRNLTSNVTPVRIDFSAPTVHVATVNKSANFTVLLSWPRGEDATSGINHYEVQASVNSSSEWTTITTTTSTSTAVPGVPMSLLRFRLRYSSSCGFSVVSNEIKVLVDRDAPVVTGLTGTYASATSVSIDWSGVDRESGVAEYEVHKATYPGPWEECYRGKVPAATITGRTNTVAMIRVRAKDNVGNVGPWSESRALLLSADTKPGRNDTQVILIDASGSPEDIAHLVEVINGGGGHAEVTTDGGNVIIKVTGNTDNLTKILDNINKDGSLRGLVKKVTVDGGNSHDHASAEPEMKMVIETKGGRRFYAFREERKAADPAVPDESVRSTLRRSWLYSDQCMRALVRRGAILRPPFEPSVVLISLDAPKMAGGLDVGFWKLIPRRFSLKHVMATRDRRAEPELWAGVEQWLDTFDFDALERQDQPPHPLLDPLFPSGGGGGGGGGAPTALGAAPAPAASPTARSPPPPRAQQSPAAARVPARPEGDSGAATAEALSGHF
eukprot:m51a1_g8242 hypothetical protein (1044) ;mRNA; f:102720-110421